MGRVLKVILLAFGASVAAAVPVDTRSAQGAPPSGAEAIRPAPALAPAPETAAGMGGSPASRCAPAPQAAPELLVEGGAGEGAAPPTGPGEPVAGEGTAPPTGPGKPDAGGAEAGISPPPGLMPSVLLDDVSGGVFGSAFWPDPTKVPGSGPYPGGTGQVQPARRDTPGTATGANSSLTITGSFR